VAYHGVHVLDPNSQMGLLAKPNRKGGKSGNKKLPRHSRPGTLTVVETKAQKCLHALSKYDDVTTPSGKTVMIRYAMPCIVGHKKSTKSPTHKDLAGRKWQ
jgi:hypothetical protein